ncbi:ferredoxin FdxA [Nitratireductor pacificus]|uniref:Ferredoxin n=1 Tax=Nitratireductor pacificus pht-3B TaxID=391937 RepID=K2N1P6_9HYPH|nr:ferredoxin FdxA [Nitratireductor pacificus]EKF18108.1 4Fe-4S ferredoxin [Nitratireductor pacificus pht-3B]
MTHVVTEACIGCRFTDCVSVCPVDCFHAGDNFLVINPNGCIDCGVCIPECPEEAIHPDTMLPEGQEHFLDLNRVLAEKWPVILEAEPHPADAAEHRGKAGKLEMLRM